MRLDELLENFPDPRGLSGRDYPIGSLMALIILSHLLGRQGLMAAHRLGREMTKVQLSKIGLAKKKTPAHATLTELVRHMDSKALCAYFAGFHVKCPLKGQHIALDGKTMCASKNELGAAVHCVSAFATQLRATLQVEGGVGKGLEIPTALKLLENLELKGAILTGDALFCTQNLIAKIVERQADYLLPVKDNQRDLKEEIETAFDTPLFPPKEL